MEIKKTWKEKGFTMAELLIVVAIIAVLAAIAIPIFSNQLEKSREGTDADTLRNAYAKAALAALDISGKNTGETYTDSTGFITKAEDNNGVKTVVTKSIEFVQTAANWTELGSFEIGGLTIPKDSIAPLAEEGTQPVTFTFAQDGSLSEIKIGNLDAYKVSQSS